jgi:hypothetical protein
MSLWGNADKSTLTGTVTVASNSATVTGSGTAFTDEIGVGDLLMVTTDTTANRVLSITSDTVLTLTANYAGADAGASKAVHKRETPRNLTISDSNAIFGVTEAEMSGGGDNIVSIAVDSGGSGYVDADDAAVTISGGGGSSGEATAVVTAGKLTSVTITNQGTGYTSVPTVAIHAATPAEFNSASASVVIVGTDIITLSSAEVDALATGDAVTYDDGDGTAIAGLTTATVYYVIEDTSTTIKLATTVENANAGTAIDLTAVGVGTHTLTGATATAVANLGSGSPPKVVHPGWVKRTVGTGGRAGRIHYETLVAMSTITGEAEGSIDEFPE